MKTDHLRWGLLVLLVMAGCTDMKDQPRFEPLEASDFFEDGRTARLPVEGTVARGHLEEDAHLYRGLTDDGQFVSGFPFPITEPVLARGRERYDIFCSPCHDRTGSGEGMIVQRGYKNPPSFHDDRLRAAADGYFFDVITHGFGTMQGYASQVRAADRWAIIAYVRALQLSQFTPADSVPADVREQLEQGHAVDTRPQPEEVTDDHH